MTDKSQPNQQQAIDALNQASTMASLNSGYIEYLGTIFNAINSLGDDSEQVKALSALGSFLALTWTDNNDAESEKTANQLAKLRLCTSTH